MPTGQTLGTPSLRGATVEELRQETQAWLTILTNSVDQVIGNRGQPSFQAAPTLNGHQLTKIGKPTQDDDAQQSGLSLALNGSGKRYDAKGKSIDNLPFATEFSQAVSLAQLLAELAKSRLDLGTLFSFTLTGTGFAVNPTATALAVLFTPLVVLYVPSLTGTSNATGFTLTGLPAALQPTQASNHITLITDGQGGATDAYGLLQLAAGSLTVTMVSPVSATGVWTASGTKTVHACWVIYALL